MSQYTYEGAELDLFARALNWKRYLASRLRGYIGREVLEVGAGIGGTTGFLCDGSQRRWVCLEPDTAMAQRLAQRVAAGELPSCCSTRVGTTQDPADLGRFDTVVYIDVLEHLDDDAAELARAAELLETGGRVLAVSPAHQWLFSPFDASIGHRRRYTRAGLAAAAPPFLRCVRLEYLDSVGMLASWANRVLLRQALPTQRQIGVYDRCMVPLSRLLDPLAGRRVGKSVLAVWQKA